MAKDTKRVIRLSAEPHRVVAQRAKEKGVSLSVATDELVLYAHNRLEALRKDREKRAANSTPKPRKKREKPTEAAAAE